MVDRERFVGRAFWQSWLALLALVLLLPSCQTVSNDDGFPGKKDLVQITAESSQLKQWFARNEEQPRALALLSST